MWRRSRFTWIAVASAVAGAAAIVFLVLNRHEGFDSLELLVAEMIVAIEEQDEKRLDRLCHGPIEVSIGRLIKQHASLDYMALLYENRSWTRANFWKLGGHGPRLGHIHIDCVRQLDGKWYLKRIWGCR